MLGEPRHPRPGARRARAGRRPGTGRRRRGRGRRAGGRARCRVARARRRALRAPPRSSAGGLASPGTRQGRERWALYIDWLRDEAEAAGAELRTGVAATAQDVLADAPDAVILATGSRAPLHRRAPRARAGDRRRRRCSSTDPRRSGRGRRSCSTTKAASWRRPPRNASSPRASAVEIATTHPVVGAEIDPTQQPFVFRRLALAGVVMTPHLQRRRRAMRDGVIAAQHLHRARRAARGRRPRGHGRLPPRCRRSSEPTERAASPSSASSWSGTRSRRARCSTPSPKAPAPAPR